MPEEGLLDDSISNEEPEQFYEETPSQDEEMSDEPFDSSQDEDLSYVAVKGIYFTPKADNAGIFCLIYKGNNGKVIFRELWGIRSNREPISVLSENWEAFIRDMNKIGTYDKDSSDKLSPLIEKSLSNNIKEYLYKNINETEFAASEIRKALEKALRYLVEVKVEAEIFGEERAEKGGVIRDKIADSAQTNAGNSRDFMDVINLQGIPLICQPIIDPVNGRPVSNIAVGDIVHVSIQETNDIARKVMDFVRIQGGLLAFPVTHVQSLESGNCVILMRISDEITGVLNLSPKIMLKTDALKKDESLFKKLHLNPISIMMFCGVVLFIVLLLYLIARII